MSAATRPPATSLMVVGAAASVWMRPLITGPPRPLRVVGVSGPACYARVGHDMIAIETAGGARLPNALAVEPGRPDLDELVVGVEGVVGAGGLRAGAHSLAVRRWWDPHPRVGTVDPTALAAGRDRLPIELPDGHAGYGLVAPIARLRNAAKHADDGAVAELVDDLVGRGPGSTPTGDDVLAGLLATLRTLADPGDQDAGRFADAVAHATADAGQRTTALSATLLRCANDGAVVEAARKVFRALAGHGRLDQAITTLAAVGHTSGRDLLIGISAAVELLTTERKRT